MQVFLVRHGERLDEALAGNVESSTTEKWRMNDRAMMVDPPLTLRGYEQAHLAFTRMRLAFQQEASQRHEQQQRRIAFVTSPTRRTMGTSLMIGSSGMNHHFSCTDWGLAQSKKQILSEREGTQNKRSIPNNEAKDKEKQAPAGTASTLPIMVLNGLSCCAAWIDHLGGAESATEEGVLPCTDVPVNDGSRHCPAAVELKRIQKLSAQVVPTEGSQSTDVQYLKLQSTNCEMVPLSPPIHPGYDKDVDVLAPNEAVCSNEKDERDSIRLVPKQCTQQTKNESFMDALDRAVLLAEWDGCDTLVITAHREAVPLLLEKWGTNNFRFPQHLNYCCIASFLAKKADPSQKSYKWEYYGTTDYQDFDETNIPGHSNPSNHSSAHQSLRLGHDNDGLYYNHVTITNILTRKPWKSGMYKSSDRKQQDEDDHEWLSALRDTQMNDWH